MKIESRAPLMKFKRHSSRGVNRTRPTRRKDVNRRVFWIRGTQSRIVGGGVSPADSPVHNGGTRQELRRLPSWRRIVCRAKQQKPGRLLRRNSIRTNTSSRHASIPVRKSTIFRVILAGASVAFHEVRGPRYVARDRQEFIPRATVHWLTR